MSKDVGLLKKINYASTTDAARLNIGATNFVFSVYENDIQFTAGKQIRILSGTERLIQSILKILLTPKGSMLEDVDYGTNLDAGIGSKMQQENYADLQAGVVSALQYLMLLDADNPNPDEVIDQVNEVRAVQDTEDPRAILIYISVVTRSGKLVNVVVPQVQ